MYLYLKCDLVAALIINNVSDDVIMQHLFPLFYLDKEPCHHCDQSEKSHLTQSAHADLIEQEESNPAHFLGCVRRIPHAVHRLHVQLLDEAASQVAQPIKAVPPLVTAHTAVTWGDTDVRGLSAKKIK